MLLCTRMLLNLLCFVLPTSTYWAIVQDCQHISEFCLEVSAQGADMVGLQQDGTAICKSGIMQYHDVGNQLVEA